MTKCNKCGEWWTPQCPSCFSKERASGSLQPDGSAAVIVAKGYYRLKEENERLKEWIREEGIRTDTCTYNILGEICEGCRCKRQPQQNKQITKP